MRLSPRQVLIFALIPGACAEPIDEPVFDTAVCDESVVTYHTFAEGFFLNWCVSCHSSDLIGEEERQEAPDHLNYETYGAVVDNLLSIEGAVLSEEPYMPPVGGPDYEETELLREWIACGNP